MFLRSVPAAFQISMSVTYCATVLWTQDVFKMRDVPFYLKSEGLRCLKNENCHAVSKAFTFIAELENFHKKNQNHDLQIISIKTTKYLRAQI